MYEITDADRKAAERLRVVLADISGFWHQVGDESPLCVALAQHRAEVEQRFVAKIVPLKTSEAPARRDMAARRLGLPTMEAEARKAAL